MGLGGVMLAAFAIVASGLVAVTYDNTKERIAENEKQVLLNSLHVLVPPELHDNDLYTDRVDVQSKTLSYREKPVTAYLATKDKQPVAAILSVVAPDGYSGAIKLLVAIRWDGTLLGVRVVAHKETPGLGDAIESEKSNWIKIFEGKSLTNPSEREWLVKKDGGEFDQLTGATITPRAVVGTVYKSLRFFRIHKQLLFSILPQS